MTIKIHDIFQLQNMQNDLAGDYELANDIDASGLANPTTDRGDWQDGVVYHVNDYILNYGTRYWLCTEEHTSSSANRPPQTGFMVAHHWDYWSTHEPPEYVGFRPIGISGPYNPFTGSLDGKGFKIIGLMSHRIDAGLFDDIANATIKDVHLENVDIDGAPNAAGIVVYMANGAISGCSVSGSIIGQRCAGILHYMEAGTMTDCHVLESTSMFKREGHGASGGAIGYLQRGTVSGCSVKAPITGECSRTIAGFVGYNQSGHIHECYVETDIVSPTNSVFGFAGYCEDGTIQGCYYRGKVCGYWACGFAQAVGDGGLIEDCYVAGTVESDIDWIGGFISDVYDGGVVRRCYVAAEIICNDPSPDDVGGFAAYLTTDGAIEDCFWDTTLSSAAVGIAWDGGGSSNLEGKTTAEMQQLSTFKNAGWDIGHTYHYNPNDGYPFLSWQVGSSSIWLIPRRGGGWIPGPGPKPAPPVGLTAGKGGDINIARIL